MEFSYYFSEGTKADKAFIQGKSCVPDEVKSFLDKLIKPNNCVSISTAELDSIDFWCLEDGQIEMEILQRGNDDFAIVDVPLAKQIVDVIFTTQQKTLARDLLKDLPIKWI